MYRIQSSMIEGRNALKAAFEQRGIVDHCNALAKGSRSRMTQVFVMADGKVVAADSRIVSEVVREAGRAA